MQRREIFKHTVVALGLATSLQATAAVTPAELGLNEADILNALAYRKSPSVAPGLSFGSPVAFGLNWGEVGVGLGGTWDPGDPASKELDGSAAISVGFGDSVRHVGLETYIAINSLASQRGQDSFGSEGSFGAKLHTVVPGRMGFAVGVENIGRFGDATQDTRSSVYAVATKFFDLLPQAKSFKYPLAVNFGFGNGRFVAADKQDEHSAGPFGGIDLLLSTRHSLTVDWTGRDLNAGISVLPFRRVPLVVTVGGVNLTHQGEDRAAYAVNVGYLFRFKK